MRYVTLCEQDDNGFSVVEPWPDADREEVAGVVNEFYPEVVPVLVAEVTTVTERTTAKDGSVTEKSYEQQTGNLVPDPSGATQETGNTLERVTDPGGELRVYQGTTLLREYPAGVWRSCSADPPEWMTDGAEG